MYCIIMYCGSSKLYAHTLTSNLSDIKDGEQLIIQVKLTLIHNRQFHVKVESCYEVLQ